jgi:signal transduction histidine kinase
MDERRSFNALLVSMPNARKRDSRDDPDSEADTSVRSTHFFLFMEGLRSCSFLCAFFYFLVASNAHFLDRLRSNQFCTVLFLSEGENMYATRESIGGRTVTSKRLAVIRLDEDDLFQVLDAIPIGVHVFERDMRIRWLNKIARRRLRPAAPSDLVGCSWYDMHPEMIAHRPVHRRVRAGESIDVETVEVTTPDGPRYYDIRYQPLPTLGGMVAFSTDVTERYCAAELSYASNRLESLGRFAGGVAHDLNNHLTVIFGYLYMAIEDLGADHPVTRNLIRGTAVGRSAKTLLEKLLDFPHQRAMVPKLESLSELIEQIADRMLGPLLAKGVRVTFNLAPVADDVLVDASAVERIFVNLLVNANTAMPDGGLIQIRTYSKELPAVDCPGRYTDSLTGEYAILEFSDNGVGMDRETLTQCFEPFFTTNENGQSRGLGLATCLSVVREMGGEIGVESEVGRGTRFFVVLPRVRTAEVLLADVASDDEASNEVASGDGTSDGVLTDDRSPCLSRRSLFCAVSI